MRTILVSSCLLGLKTRYDGTDNRSQEVIDFLCDNQLLPIPVCPEQLAGLSTPRPKCWFLKGDGEAVSEAQGHMTDENGQDVTEKFRHGARETLKIAQLTDCAQAILQQRSPSCGTAQIYLKEKLVAGMGVTAAVLQRNGLTVYGDDQLPNKKS